MQEPSLIPESAKEKWRRDGRERKGSSFAARLPHKELEIILASFFFARLAKIGEDSTSSSASAKCSVTCYFG